MLRDLLNDLSSPYSSLGDRYLAGFVFTMLAVGAGLIGLLGFMFVNSVGIIPTETAFAVVEEKKIVPAYKTTTIMMVGKVMVPVINNYHESYRLYYEINRHKLESAVKKEFFDSVRIGEKIEINYGLGRLNESYEPLIVKSVQ